MSQQDLNDQVVVFRGGQVQRSEAIMDPFIDGSALVTQEGSEGTQLAPGGSIVVGHVGVLVLGLGVSSSGQQRSHNLLHMPMCVVLQAAIACGCWLDVES